MSMPYDPEPPPTVGIAEVRGGTGRVRLLGVSGTLPRVALTIVGVTAFVLGASGFDTTKVFHQYSTLKWAMLVAAPLLVIVLLTVERPSAWALGLVVVTVPIEPYVATIHGQPISVLLVTLVVANIVVEVEDREVTGLHRGVRRSCGSFRTQWCCSWSQWPPASSRCTNCCTWPPLWILRGYAPRSAECTPTDGCSSSCSSSAPPVCRRWWPWRSTSRTTPSTCMAARVGDLFLPELLLQLRHDRPDHGYVLRSDLAGQRSGYGLALGSPSRAPG